MKTSLSAEQVEKIAKEAKFAQGLKISTPARVKLYSKPFNAVDFELRPEKNFYYMLEKYVYMCYNAHMRTSV